MSIQRYIVTYGGHVTSSLPAEMAHCVWTVEGTEYFVKFKIKHSERKTKQPFFDGTQT